MAQSIKKGPFSQVEDHFIMTSGKTASQIAKILNRSERSIIERLKKVDVAKETAKPDSPIKEAKEAKSKEQLALITKQMVSKPGSAIMNEANSELTEEVRTVNFRDTHHYQNTIYNPKA